MIKWELVNHNVALLYYSQDIMRQNVGFIFRFGNAEWREAMQCIVDRNDAKPKRKRYPQMAHFNLRSVLADGMRGISFERKETGQVAVGLRAADGIRGLLQDADLPVIGAFRAEQHTRLDAIRLPVAHHSVEVQPDLSKSTGIVRNGWMALWGSALLTGIK